MSGQAQSGGHVLVVDDDPDVRRLVRLVLENAGFTVSEIPDGRLAVGAASRLRPDLILIDWVMADLDGCAATAQLKRDPQTAPIPVVMMSAKLNAADKIDALAAGVGDFVDKPFHAADLLAKVRHHVRRRRSGEAQAASATAPPPGAALELDDLTAAADGAAARKDYDAAAKSYSLAAEAAVGGGDSDLGNKLLRLAGKMRLLQAEACADPQSMHDAYRAAARFFLAAGNLSLATQANAAAKAALGRVPPA